jgi:cystathionine gamma-synthase
VAIFPAAAYDEARRFWRFCGECVSTRQAADALGTHPTEVSAMEGHEANQTIRARIASLAGQQPEDVFLFPSGMAANYAVHRMLTTLFPGRKTAQLDFPYVDVLKLQQRFGSGAHFLPMIQESEYDDLRRLLKGEVLAGLFCEAPSNPLLRCVDFERLLEIRAATQPDTPIIVDDTISTVVHADAHRVADVVTTSLTKSFSGQSDVLAGSVVLNRRSPHHAAFSAFLLANADHELWRGDEPQRHSARRSPTCSSGCRSSMACQARWRPRLRIHPSRTGRPWLPILLHAEKTRNTQPAHV